MELTMKDREERLLNIIASGLAQFQQSSTLEQLGDRASYIGMSDVASYFSCPRAAVLKRAHGQGQSLDLPRLLALSRGHWFESGVAQAFDGLELPHIRQLEISTQYEGVDFKAHLDFVLATTQPRPTVRILEVKSCQKLPEFLYSSYEMQVYGQIGLLAENWNKPCFSYVPYTGAYPFDNLSFPSIANIALGAELPWDVRDVDLEAWVLCLSMQDAKVFGPGDKVVFGDWRELGPILEANQDAIEDMVIENDRRNSALPLLDIKNLEARIEPGAIIREQVSIGKNAVIMMGAVLNIGASVGEGTMIDIGAKLGGRATVGKNCHIAAGAILAGVIEPASGYLACGDTGPGKMPEPEILLEYILREIAMEKDLKGKKILVTAGPTQEAIDPVRYITNHSSGKMGYAIAEEFTDRIQRRTLCKLLSFCLIHKGSLVICKLRADKGSQQYCDDKYGYTDYEGIEHARLIVEAVGGKQGIVGYVGGSA